MAAFIGDGSSPVSRNICDLWAFNTTRDLRSGPTLVAAVEWFATGVADAQSQTESGMCRSLDCTECHNSHVAEN